MFEREIDALKALANGIDYFTGEKCINDSILNDPDIIRTLYRVCEILKDVPPKKVKKADFVCPLDLERKFDYEEGLSLTQIIDKIASLYPNMKRLKYSQVADILIRKGLLEKVLDEDGKTKNKATSVAEKYGIINKQKVSAYGRQYEVVNYTKDGQKFVLSCLKEIR